VRATFSRGPRRLYWDRLSVAIDTAAVPAAPGRLHPRIGQTRDRGRTAGGRSGDQQRAGVAACRGDRCGPSGHASLRQHEKVARTLPTLL